MITEPYCPHCGTRVETDKAGPEGDQAWVQCPTCLQKVQRPPDQAPPQVPPDRPPVPPRGPAWEDSKGALSGLFKTIGQMLFHPRRTLSAPGKTKLIWPLSFGLILSVLGSAGMRLGNVIMGYDKPGGLDDLVGFVTLQLFVIVWLFFDAAVVHLCLWIVRGAKNGYRATFRSVCYGNAGTIWMIIPGIGVLIALFWSFCILVGGLAGAHGVSRLRAAVAVFLPVLVLMVLIMAGMMLFGVELLQQIMQQQGLGQLWTV
jgi:endogenous inhibitor of DNA gyrase (YacG/DUF329 family)